MRRYTAVLLLVLIPLTLAPRTARQPGGGALTTTVTIQPARAAGATVPFRVRVTNTGATNADAAKILLSSTTAGVSVLATSHGCVGASADKLPVTCTVNVPAGQTRVINGVLRSASAGTVALAAVRG